MPGRQPPFELPAYDDEQIPSPFTRVTLLHWVRLALTAASRRRLLTAFVFLMGVVATTAYYSTKRPTYRVEAKILAQRPQALPSVVRPLFEDVPTRSAWEMIHRRENLISLVQQSGLLGTTAQTSQQTVGRDATNPAENALDLLVLELDKRLLVMVEDGTITIQLDWRDPQQAYAIVNGALQNFLEARHLQEVTAIDEVIAVLQGRANVLRKDLEKALEEARRRPQSSARPLPQTKPPSEELLRLQSALEAKQRAVQDVEEFRRRRLADLIAQLDQARNTFSDAHPTVVALRQQVESLRRESPQSETLREEERRLRKEYHDRLSREGGTTEPVRAAEIVSAPEEDQRVREARLQFEQMNARAGAALVERDAARGAFKYRYNVIWPPQIPREPVGPNRIKILGGGALASLLAAVAAAMLPDVLRGRVVQRWQVERVLGLSVVGELKHH